MKYKIIVTLLILTASFNSEAIKIQNNSKKDEVFVFAAFHFENRMQLPYSIEVPAEKEIELTTSMVKQGWKKEFGDLKEVTNDGGPTVVFVKSNAEALPEYFNKDKSRLTKDEFNSNEIVIVLEENGKLKIIKPESKESKEETKS